MSTFAKERREIKLDVVFSSIMKSFSSIKNCLRTTYIKSIKIMGNKISHNVVNLLRFSINKFFFINPLSLEQELPYDS